jgi:hypothetical protein
LELAEPLQLSEGEVGCVGRDAITRNPPPRGGQAGVASGPDTIGAAEVGDARVGADAGAREGDDVFGADDPTRKMLDLPLATDDQEFSFSWTIRRSLTQLDRDGDGFPTMSAVRRGDDVVNRSVA